jgi:hypothetical protein
MTVTTREQGLNGWRWRIFQRDNNGMETTSNMIVSSTDCAWRHERDDAHTNTSLHMILVARS